VVEEKGKRRREGGETRVFVVVEKLIVCEWIF
jgi:hypothetical protein